MYEVDYTVGIPEYGVLNVEADDPDDAEGVALKQLKETFPDSITIEVEMIKVIK